MLEIEKLALRVGQAMFDMGLEESVQSIQTVRRSHDLGEYLKHGLSFEEIMEEVAEKKRSWTRSYLLGVGGFESQPHLVLVERALADLRRGLGEIPGEWRAELYSGRRVDGVWGFLLRGAYRVVLLDSEGHRVGSYNILRCETWQKVGDDAQDSPTVNYKGERHFLKRASWTAAYTPESPFEEAEFDTPEEAVLYEAQRGHDRLVENIDEMYKAKRVLTDVLSNAKGA